MKRLIMVRHGETSYNLEGRLQGVRDIPLNAQGRAQAMQLARYLSSEHFDAAYSSDLRRAWGTAQLIVAEHAPLDLHADSRLREPSKGIWEGLTWSEIVARYPDQAAAYQADRECAPEGGETLSAIVVRVTAVLRDLERAHPQRESVLVVAHGQLLRLLICVAVEIAPKRFLNFNMDNTSVSELRYYPTGVVLHRLNDTAHLRDGSHD